MRMRTAGSLLISAVTLRECGVSMPPSTLKCSTATEELSPGRTRLSLAP